jgi:hypothetical protein
MDRWMDGRAGAPRPRRSERASSAWPWPRAPRDGARLGARDGPPPDRPPPTNCQPLAAKNWRFELDVKDIVRPPGSAGRSRDEMDEGKIEVLEGETCCVGAVLCAVPCAVVWAVPRPRVWGKIARRRTDLLCAHAVDVCAARSGCSGVSP